MEAPCIKYHLENHSPLKAHTVEFVLHALGYRAEQTGLEQCTLYYGNGQRGGVLRIPDAPDHGPLWREALSHEFDPGRILHFDAINAISILLKDTVNRLDGLAGEPSKTASYDQHDRLVYASSWQAENGCGEVPVVNAYVCALGKALRGLIPGEPLPMWPEGKLAAIGLSHDVDRLDPWSEIKGSVQRPEVGYLLDAARSVLRNIVRPHDDFGLFRDLIKYEAGLGFRSTFMFASVNRYSPYSDSHDVAYDVTSLKVRRLFDSILSSGFEIGLHSSYNARENSDRFSHERRRLEDLTGGKITGQRHHFWHTARHAELTLKQHEDAGFSYDSSVAFNDHLGFRRNAALPYYPWLAEHDRAVNVMELPVFCMDGNLFYRPEQPGADQLSKILALVKTLKYYRGIGVIDWHSDTSHPSTPGYQSWGTCYFALLRALAEDSSLWVTSLEEIVAWTQQRRARLDCRRPAELNLKAVRG